MAILTPACTVAEFFHRLAEQNTPGTRKLLVKVDEVCDQQRAPGGLSISDEGRRSVFARAVRLGCGVPGGASQ
jgi:hypothetical protein